MTSSAATPEDVTRTNQTALFKVTDLSCVFNAVALFQNVSFTLSGGDILQIVGPNGSGKTTLLRMLCGLKRPEQGQILWRDQSIHELDTDYLSLLSYIGHRNGIKAGLTVRENLVMQQALVGKRSKDRREEALERVGLINHAETTTAYLSSGQQRRLALARLMLSETMLWILDEPFTSLDDEGKSLVNELLSQHRDEGGLTVLATHESVRLNSLSPLSVSLS